MKSIFTNTDRVRKAGIPQGKPAEYKNSKTIITGEPMKKAGYKPKPLIQKPTIGEKANRTVGQAKQRLKTARDSAAKGAKSAVGSALKGAKSSVGSVTKGFKGAMRKTTPALATRYPDVARMEKTFSKGGKVYK